MSTTISGLLVDLQVNSAALRSGLDKAQGHIKAFGDKTSAVAAKIDGIAKGFEQVGKKAAIAGAVLTGTVVAALRSAAQHNVQVAREVDKVKSAFGSLAGELAKAVLPVVKEFANALLSVVGWIRSMSPETKASLVHWIKITAEVLAVAAVLGKVAEGIAVVSKIASGVGALLSSGILVPMIAVVAIVGVAIMIVGLLSKAWKTLSTETKKRLGDIGETIKDVFLAAVTAPLDAITWVLDKIARMASWMGGHGPSKTRDFFRAQAREINGLIQVIQGDKTFAEAFPAYFKAGKEFGSNIKEGLIEGLDVLGLKGLYDKVAGMFSGHAAKAAAGPLKRITNYAIENGAIGSDLAAGSVNANQHFANRVYAPNRIKNTTASGNTETSAAANDRLANAASNAARALAGEFIPKLGKLGAAISAATGEFAKKISAMAESAGTGASAGGIIGAVVGVLASLLGDSEGFMGVVTIIDALVQTLANGLGGLIGPVQLVAAALMPLIQGIVAMVKPFWSLVGLVANILIPPITALGMMLQGFAPLMNIVAGSMLAIFATVVGATLPAMQLLFEAFRVLGIGALSIGKWAGRWWNSVSEAIAQIMDSIASIQLNVLGLVVKPFAALGDVGKQLRETHVGLSDLDKQMDDLRNLTWEGAQAQAENTRQTILGTEAIEKATASFLNVPSGYRMALARFDAQGGGAGALPGAGVTGTAFAPNLPPMEVTVNVHGANDPEQFANKFGQLLRDHTFNSRGRYGRRRI